MTTVQNRAIGKPRPVCIGRGNRNATPGSCVHEPVGDGIVEISDVGLTTVTASRRLSGPPPTDTDVYCSAPK